MGNGKKGGKPAAPELPKDAPADVKAFVDCTGLKVTLKKGKITWLPLPAALKEFAPDPEATFEAGDKAGSVKIKVSLGFSLTLTATVTDGQLSLDAKIPEELADVVDTSGVKDWTDELNAWFKANGKKLDPLTLKAGELTLSKSAIAAAGGGAGAAKDGAEPKKEEPKGTPGKVKAAAATGAFLLGIGGGGLLGDIQGQSHGDIVQPTRLVAFEEVPTLTPPVTIRLPDGDVGAEMTASPEAGGNDVLLAGIFHQTGNDLVLVVGNLPPFVGTIDDQAAFDISNDVGSFTGSFTGKKIRGRHIFEGTPYALVGTLAKPVREVPTEGGAGPALVNYLADNLDYGPVSLAGEDGGVGALFWIGLGLAVLGVAFFALVGDLFPGCLGVVIAGTLLLGGAGLLGYDLYSDGHDIGPLFWVGLAVVAAAALLFWWGPRFRSAGTGLALALVFLLIGIGVMGYDLFTGGEDGGPRYPFAFLDERMCVGCAVDFTSAEVQQREGSTLFVIGGDWPTTVAGLRTDLFLGANDLGLMFHPETSGISVSYQEGTRQVPAKDIAVGVRPNAFLVDLQDEAIQEPLTFAFGEWDGTNVGQRIPASGLLEWDGRGAPTPIEGTQPPQASPSPSPSPGAVTSPGTQETPEAFAAELAKAIRKGDETLLFARLNPAVVARYGAGPCRRFTRGVHDTTRRFTVLDVSAPGPFDYTTDGLTTTIPVAYTLTVDQVAEGQASRGELHFAAVGPLMSWFTDCGTPLT